ncbi:MAG: hypothetical protein K9M56_04425 [Victivallales bacterium]|nr:hypothetical protein [Victivallales bacterium]
MKKPALLKNIKFVNYELTKTDYEIKGEADEEKGGYSEVKTGFGQEIEIDKKNKKLLMHSKIMIKVFNGEIEGEQKDEILSLTLQIKLLYLYTTKNIDKEKINKLRWFFQSQANIINGIVAKNYLSQSPRPLRDILYTVYIPL